jgi:hypothetical protein
LDPTGILLFLLLPLILAFVLVVFASALLVVVEAVAVLVAAYLFRGHWIVEAVSDGPPPETRRAEARGWRASRRAFAEMVAGLER